MATVVFLHAHPDDEVVFTGGTMARLAAIGHRVVLVVATGGEAGDLPEGVVALGDLGEMRRRETEAAAALLGVERVVFLGYHDSGMAGDPANADPRSLWMANLDEVAERVATVLREEGSDALVTYDAFGIYGHPDHLQVHRAGRRTLAVAGIPTLYEATVDREYLHFVETHLVEEAILAGDLGLVRSHIGVASVEVSTTVAVDSVLECKREAMAAHASQIPETTSALRLPSDQFAAVYGWEWFVREGPPGPIDELV